MLPIIQTLSISLAAVLIVMTLVWVASIVKRDASIIDPMWGAGFTLLAWLACWLNSPTGTRPTLLAVLTSIWGIRLATYLLWRIWGQDEDRRYRAMRDYHGPRFWWVSLFTVFIVQAFLLWFVSLPIQVAATFALDRPLNWLDGCGLLLWAVGLTFETVGDWQLARFKAESKNAGRVLDRGLWRLTRHPNYFGDFCVWWGIYLIAAAGGAWWTIASPIVMSILLLKVSGVTLLEGTIVERRPDYAAYKARTNAFFPGPQRVG